MEAPPAAIFPLDQTFQLSSRPSATKTIYLDFDGHTTTGTLWQNGATFVTPPYSIDGSPTFSNTELLNIQNIWARVTEAFSPFDVNVTTQEPPLDDLRNTGGADNRWGIRVVIGGNNSWLGRGGGVAYTGSFSWNSDTPTFVFSENLSNGNPKVVADAVNHEVGHTLGLWHDGLLPTPAGPQSDSYYEGHGTGATGWAPIMGVGYSRQLVQWSKGEYLNANNQQQDDLEIITTQNGFGYRPDDHGNTFQTATQYVGANLAGVIERNTDVDVFRFYTSNRAIIDVRPWEYGPTLDILAELVDSSGTVIETSNPADSLNASFNRTVAAGVYYVRVQGTGKGDPLGTGYTDYGSLGQYTVSLTVDANPAIASVEDRVGSIQGSVPNGGRTNDSQPLISGVGAPDSTITLRAGGVTLGTQRVAFDGTWSIVVAPQLIDGTYQFLVSDSFGGVAEATFTITVDTIPPPAPLLVAVIDDVGLIQGPLTSGSRTDDTTIRLEGTAVAGSLVTVYGNGLFLGSTSASGSGNWTFTTPNLSTGAHAFTITASDDVGNESMPSTPLFNVTVDPVPPAVPVISSVFDSVLPMTGSIPNGGATNDRRPLVSGTGQVGSVIRVSNGNVLIGTATVGGGGSWTLSPSSNLADGGYSLVAVANNDIGATSAPSSPFAFSVDTQPPSLTITRLGAGPLTIGSTTTVTFTISEPVATFDAGVITTTGGSLTGFSGSGSVYTATFTPAADFEGPASIAVPAEAFTDAVGYTNTAAALDLAVDTVAPTIALSISGPALLKVGDTATVTFVLREPAANFGLQSIIATGGTLSGLQVAGTTYTATFVPHRQFRGSATVAVPADRFTDQAGNGNLAGNPLSVEVDTIAPRIIGFRGSPGTAVLGIDGTVLIEADLSEQVNPGGSFVARLDSGGEAVLAVDGTGLVARGTYIAPAGDYSEDLEVIALVGNGSIRNASSNPLDDTLPVASAGLAANHAIEVDARVKFVSNGAFSTDPTFVPDAKAGFRTVPIRFTTPVHGVSIDSFMLTINGQNVPLRGARLHGSGSQYTLSLPATRVRPVGIYTLAVKPGSGVQAASNGAAATSQVVLHWGYGQSVGMIPDAPAAVAVAQVFQSGRKTSVVLGWQQPAGNGGGAVTRYVVQYRIAGSSRWLALRASVPGSATSATITGVMPGRTYEFRVAAANAAGLGAFAESGPSLLAASLAPQAITPRRTTSARR